MPVHEFKTRLQIAEELGVSYSTLRRKIKSSSLEIRGNLIPPQQVDEIKSLFGLGKTNIYSRGIDDHF